MKSFMALNAVVEEGFTALVFFFPILIVFLSVFRLYGLPLSLGFLTSVIVTTALFIVRVHLRLKMKTESAEVRIKEAILVGVIVVTTFLIYTAIYSAIALSNFAVCFVLAFVTYMMWRYYESLEGEVSVGRIVRLCIYVSIFNIIFGLIYALKNLSFALIVWFSCWIGLIVALAVFLSFRSRR